MIRLIIWILIAIVALSFFGISLQSIIESPTSQQNFAYFFDLVLDGLGYIVRFFTELFERFADIIPGL